MLPADWVPGPNVVPKDLNRVMFITVHPDQVAPPALATVDRVIAVGRSPEKTVAAFCAAVGEAARAPAAVQLEQGEVYLWSRPDGTGRRVRLVPSAAEHHRHLRKYAEGELPPDRSFYFRGPEGKLNLRAQNLILFMQLADGVDDATWTHHLQNGDYTRWFQEHIKDKVLAEQAAALAERRELSARESRAELRAIIEKSYTLPAGPPLPIPGTAAEAKN